MNYRNHLIISHQLRIDSSTKHFLPFFSLLLLCVNSLIAGCANPFSTTTDSLQGTVLIWHTWDEEDSHVLNSIAASFTDIHPDVTIKTTSIREEALQERYEDAASEGLGPDLLLGPSSWIQPLADNGLILPAAKWSDTEFWERYLDSAIEASLYKGKIYGIPESLRVMGLYYNTELVDTPAKTLDELVVQANAGQRAGMSPDFIDIFWGVQAFGGKLFDGENRVILNQGGFANWLVWLKSAQESPYIVVDKDRETLTNLFLEGYLAYLIDSTEALKPLQDSLGQDILGVASLPSGPIAPAGPFVQANVFMFSRASSPNQAKIAQELAKFLTNVEQQTKFMRRAGRISANERVRINPSVDTIAHAFSSQARNGLPLHQNLAMQTVLQYGDEVYTRALQGIMGPAEVATTLTQMINDANGLDTIEQVAEAPCLDAGTLRLWHDLQGISATAFQKLMAEFIIECPTIQVREYEYKSDELLDELTQNGSSRPDLLLIDNQYLTELVAAERVSELTTVIDNQMLQSYYPMAVDILRHKNLLYGIPYTMQPQVLFYDKSTIENPPASLDELNLALNEGASIALSSNFADSHWGIATFGGQFFDENQQALLDQGGLAGWLDWLKPLHEIERITWSSDQQRLGNAFRQGRVTYFVGRADMLSTLEEALGKDKVGVTFLPTGPVAEPTPLLTVRGFVLAKKSSQTQAQKQAQLALHLITFMTRSENQEMLVRTARQVPVSIGVTVDSDDPAITTLLEQANLSLPYPSHAQMIAAQTLGAEAITQYLNADPSEAATAEEVAAQLTNAINEATGAE